MAVSVNVHCTRHSLWFCFFQPSVTSLAFLQCHTGCLSRCLSSWECKLSSIRSFRPQVRYARHPESQGRKEWASTVFLSRRTRGYNGCSEVWAQRPWQSACLLWAPQTIFLKIKCWRLQWKAHSSEVWQVPALPSSPQDASLPPTSQHQVGTLRALGQAGVALRSWRSWGLRYSNELLCRLPDSSHQTLASSGFSSSFCPGDQWYPGKSG